jgi:large subunit ribosomal protein L33
MVREYVWLECTVCKNRNYRAQKEIRGGKKLALKKYCKFDRKHTLHSERKK